MIEKISTDEIVSIVRSATHELFSTMLSLPLADLPPHEKEQTDPPQTVDGVEALVSIAGSWSGTGRVCCTPQFACRMASALLMTEFPGLNEDVLDAVAEVANMIIGNVKTTSEERLGPLALSIPTVIFGSNYHTRSARALRGTAVPFHCQGDVIEVRFFLVETPRYAAARPVLQTA